MEAWIPHTLPATAQQTSYAYDADGRLTDVTQDVTGFAVDTHTDYDNLGRVKTVSEAYGSSDVSRTSYTYDNANRVLTVTRGAGTAEASTTTTSYDGEGNVVETWDGNNNPTTYTYDAAGQLITKTDALGNTTSYAYDAFGNVIATTDPLGNKSHAWYDALNRVIFQTDQLNYLTATTYTIGGAVHSVTRYGTTVTIPSNGSPPALPAPNGTDATTTFTPRQARSRDDDDGCGRLFRKLSARCLRRPRRRHREILDRGQGRWRRGPTTPTTAAARC